MMEIKHVLLLMAVAALIVTPLIVFPNAGYGGADGVAKEIIQETGYEPWFKPVWEPPSGEIASLLFATQAAIGAMIIGYFIGYEKGKKCRPSES